MNEESKSIWRKPLNGPRGLFLWFALLASAIFVVMIAFVLLAPGKISIKDILIGSSFFSVVIAGSGVLLFAFFRWAFCRRNLRRTFFGLVCLSTLIALFYVVENWRGKHAWDKYKREQEAKGERFDLKSLAPPPVPDDQNFAMTRIWVEEISAQMGAEKAAKWYGDKVAALGHTNFVRPLEMPVELYGQSVEFTNKSNGWPNAEKFDLKLWQDYYRKLAAVNNFFPVASQPQPPAQDVLLALSKYDSQIEELRRASKLPYSRFPLGYADDDPAGILLPHLASMKGCFTTLRLRAIAELQNGQTEKALEDINLMFRLMEAIRNEPALISHLVRISLLQIALQPVWEGLAEHDWNDAQLSALEAGLAKLDFLADHSFSMRGELAFGVGVIDHLRRNRKEIGGLGVFRDVDSDVSAANAFEGKLNNVVDWLIPGGWFEQNKIAIARMHATYLLPVVNLETRVVSPSAQKRASVALNGKSIQLTPYNWFTRFLLPALNNVSSKSARAQSSTDLARIAIALERNRLAHGTFPETLDVLAPQFLQKIPHDIINGKALNYRRTDDGQFILYSVGWNETDDGGSIVMGKGKTPSVDVKQGDWVWKYPAK